MKFGKQLTKVIALSDAEWAPFWISYKALKKRIKELHDPEHPGPHPPRPAATAAAGPAPPAAGEVGSPPAAAAAAAAEAGAGSGGEGPSATNTEPTPKDLAQREGEVAFFKTIRAEIAKATEFYLGMEQQLGARKRRIRLGMQYLKQPTTVLEDDAWIKMRRACIALYKDLLLLENFAVMNYCACSKALKKHDKTVGLDTRARFMRNVVHQQPFTHYPRLLEMLQEMEAAFQEINAVQGESARPLEAEERLFLEAIRGLNQEASSMQREEKADLGGLPAAAGGGGGEGGQGPQGRAQGGGGTSSSDPEPSSDDHGEKPPPVPAPAKQEKQEGEGGAGEVGPPAAKRPQKEGGGAGAVEAEAGGDAKKQRRG